MAMLFSPAQAQEGSAPDKPRGLEATATHDSVTLTWDDPDDDSITGYVILRRIPGVDPQGHFNELVADTGTDATAYTDDTVSAETRYTYRSKAINGAGTSERSRWFHIDTPAAPVPDKPKGLEATATHDSVTLTWDDPGDASITGYVILRRIPGVDPQGHFNELVPNTGTAATAYTDDTVAAGLTYTYRIKAINGAGTSERSRWFHIDTPAAPVPDKPKGLEATATHGQVTLTWDDPGDDTITGYVILKRVRVNDTGGDFSVLVADTGSDATTYTDNTVAADTTYTYRIKAINEHGVSERSRWFHIDTPAAPEAAEGDDPDGEDDGGKPGQGAPGGPGKRANVSESDGEDLPATIATTGEVDVGGSVTGNIGSDGDHDWFKVELEAGKTYQIDMEGSDTSSGTLINPQLRNIRDSSGNEVTGIDIENDIDDIEDEDEYNSRAVFTPTAAGTYYLVASDGYGLTGTYTLSVREVACTLNAGDLWCGVVDVEEITNSGGSTVGHGFAGTTGDIDGNPEDKTFTVASTGNSYTISTLVVGTGGNSGNLSVVLDDDLVETATANDKAILELSIDGESNPFPLSSAFPASNGIYRWEETGLDWSSESPVTVRLREGDPPTLSVADATGDEGDAKVEFTVTLSKPRNGESRATWTASIGSGDTAVAADLGTPKTGTVTFATDATTATVEVPVVDDVTEEGDETFTVTLSSPYPPVSVKLAADPTATGTIRDDDAPADDFAADTSTTGQVDVGGSVTGNIETSGDRDWFKVVLEASTRYQIDVEGADTGRGTAADPFAALYDAGGVFLMVNDGASGVGKNARVTYTPTASGTHYVQASATSGTGTYTVSVIVLGANGVSEADTDFPNTTSSSGRVEVGASATGNIGNANDQDFFRVNLKAGKIYQIDMEGRDTGRGTDRDPFLQLFNATGVVIFAEDKDGGVGENARLTYTPAASARYFIAASRELAGGSGMGTYTLSVRELETRTAEGGTDFADDITTLGMVEVGSSATGEIDPAGDEDWFRVELEAGKVYQFDLQGVVGGHGTLPDPFLSLNDGSGSPIGNNDDTGGSLNSRLVYTATATGTHYLGASSAAGPIVTGTYTLSVRDITPPPEDLPTDTSTTGVVEVDGSAARGAIYEPEPVTYTVTDDDDNVTEHIRYDFDTDWFAVELEADKTYRIDMKGKTAGNDLTLPLPQINAIYDEDGAYLYNTWSSDESTSHYLFRVTFHVHADGTYYIAASGESFEWGSYKLTVTETADGH